MKNKEWIALADRFNSPSFIATDPVQLPHRYSEKRDREISAFVTSWISWGNRRQIIAKANLIDEYLFDGVPFQYIISRRWEAFREDERCLYRTYKYSDFCKLCASIYKVYERYPDMEAAVVEGIRNGESPVEALGRLFAGVRGIADARKGSACKRLWMFLRWMVRRDGIVDLGIWSSVSPASLLIPLDTHVYQVARSQGLTKRHTADARTAEEITASFRLIFPGDPAKGDFALFGMGISDADRW